MMQAERDTTDMLADVIDRILNKGLVINADIAVSAAGAELLGIKIRAALPSSETAAKYALGFPWGTGREVPDWQEAMVVKETCPQCGNRVAVEELFGEGCRWCGWLSAKAKWKRQPGRRRRLVGKPAPVDDILDGMLDPERWREEAEQRV